MYHNNRVSNVTAWKLWIIIVTFGWQKPAGCFFSSNVWKSYNLTLGFMYDCKKSYTWPWFVGKKVGEVQFWFITMFAVSVILKSRTPHSTHAAIWASFVDKKFGKVKFWYMCRCLYLVYRVMITQWQKMAYATSKQLNRG